MRWTRPAASSSTRRMVLDLPEPGFPTTPRLVSGTAWMSMATTASPAAPRRTRLSCSGMMSLFCQTSFLRKDRRIIQVRSCPPLQPRPQPHRDRGIAVVPPIMAPPPDLLVDDSADLRGDNLDRPLGEDRAWQWFGMPGPEAGAVPKVKILGE